MTSFQERQYTLYISTFNEDIGAGASNQREDLGRTSDQRKP